MAPRDDSDAGGVDVRVVSRDRRALEWRSWPDITGPLPTIAFFSTRRKTSPPSRTLLEGALSGSTTWRGNGPCARTLWGSLPGRMLVGLGRMPDPPCQGFP